ncbi:MAG: hypothetical protein AB7T49_18270 [Oligoflexales bacterium]
MTNTEMTEHTEPSSRNDLSDEQPYVGPEPSQLVLNECCKKTVDMHAANNAMMVCSDCKQIIKCFENERSFRNYQVFCASRHRRILATNYAQRRIVIFRSYDTYST